MGVTFSHVIEILVKDEVIVERMSGRRVHPSSGRNYHVSFNPPIKDGFDDVSGEELIQREDDKPKTVLKRLSVYHEQTKPLTNFYSDIASKTALNYFSVDGTRSVQEVFEDIKESI
jgi:adenylate kinase